MFSGTETITESLVPVFDIDPIAVVFDYFVAAIVFCGIVEIDGAFYVFAVYVHRYSVGCSRK